jgi:hypothetical protein
MTRPCKSEEREQNKRIEEAIEGKKSGKYKSYAEASKALNVALSTIYHRVNGRQTRVESHEYEQLLSEEEETELCRWIRELSAASYPPKLYAVREMAEAIRTRRIIGINDPSVTCVSYEAIGEQWVTRFMSRHPELESIIAEQIEAVRVHETSQPILEKWFENVQSVIRDFNIQPSDTYNMDKTGFSIGNIKATRVIVDRTQKIRYQAYPGRQEWVSVIECISMDGSSLPPLIIFKGKTLSSRWIPHDTPKDWFFSCNSQGWTSNEHCKKWLLKDFETNTREKAQGKTRLLIFDGHGSHTTPDVIRHCILNRIRLALLPPHSSHLTQPLDVGVFSSMKAHMTREMDRIIRTGIPRIDKIEWTNAFIKARPHAFTVRNIKSGWSGTGLFPFNPEKVLGRIPISNPLPIEPSPAARSSTPNPSLSPLDNPDLTSSPLATPAMNAANLHIKKLARTRSADFHTPERKHVVRITKALSRSLALNRIQAAELTDLKRVLAARKQRQSGKHTILRGETLIATPEMLLRIQAEKEKPKSRSRKPKPGNPSIPAPPPSNLDPELFMNLATDSESEDDLPDSIITALQG